MGRSKKTSQRPPRFGISWISQSRGWLLLVLFLGAALLYLPTWSFTYVNLDEGDYVFDNPHVSSGLSWENLVWAFTTFEACNWHPLTWLSHQLDCTLFGIDPGPAHAVNALFHAANTVLVFLVFEALTQARWRSLWVAALFAWHPTHVESVAWIAERKDLLSAFWGLGSLWFYARWAGRQGEGRWCDYVGCFVCLGLGLLCKPMLVTWPFLFLLLDVWPLGRASLSPSASLRRTSRRTDLVLEKIPFFVLSVASSIITVVAQKSGGAVVSLELLSVSDRLVNAALSYARYVGKFFWPDRLLVGYGPVLDVSPWVGWTLLLLVLAATVGVFFLPARFRFVSVGWLWFVGTLMPVIGLLQVGSQSMADRYTYLPYLGLSVVVVWGLAEWVKQLSVLRPWVVGLAVLSLGALGLVTFRQMAHWKNGETLFRHALSVESNNVDAANNLAWTYATDLDPQLRDGGKAVKLAEYLVQLTERKEPVLLQTLAAAYAESGDPARAVKTVEEAMHFPAAQSWQIFQKRCREHRDIYRQGRALRPKGG